MKTYHEYEASDIVIGDGMDEVHSFLMAQMFFIGLTGFKPLPTDDPEDKLLPIKRQIANFLNSAQKSGISIAKAEIPAAFDGTRRP